jgi:hypothetical protein
VSRASDNALTVLTYMAAGCILLLALVVGVTVAAHLVNVLLRAVGV